MIFFEVWIDDNGLLFLAVQDLLDRVGHRLRRHFGDLASGCQQGIDEAAFARFHLAHNHKHERFMDAVAQVADRLRQFFVSDANRQAVEVFDEFFNFRFVGLYGCIDECAHKSLFLFLLA